MKKIFITSLLIAALAYNCLVNVSASEISAEATASEENSVSIHLDSEYGILDFVRYELNGNDLFLVFDYQNTTNDTTMPLMAYNAKLFQNGREVTNGFSMSKPSDCDYGSVNIRPGTTLRYCEVYNLSDLSPVELEVSALFDFTGKTKETVVIDFNRTNVTSNPSTNSSEVTETEASSSADEELKNQLSEANKKIEELEKQLEEANAKVSELQGQLDAIKAAIGG